MGLRNRFIAWLIVLVLVSSVAMLTNPVGHILAQELEPSQGHKEEMDDPQIIAPRALQPISPGAVINRGLYQSVQVNVDNNNNNIVGDAANEPSIAIDPTNPNNIVIGWRQFDTIASNFRQAGYAYSDDSGVTWAFPGVLEPGQFRSDPVLAADTNGDIFYYSLSSWTSVEMFITRDKGLNWEGPILSFGGDKAWMTIDTTGGIGNNHIYAIWDSTYTCCAPGTDFTRSIDGGNTYQGPYVLDAHPRWSTLDVGPDGELYIVGATLDSSSHLLLKSTNAQNAGQTPIFDLVTNIDLGGTSKFTDIPNPGGLLGQVWVAVDPSNLSTRGNVYVLGSVDPSGSDPLDVHFIRSTDGGSTWSTPIRINADPLGSNAWQWFATMSVSPEGRIDVVWNDTRNDPTAVNSELYYAYSTDAGNTWHELPVSPPFNSLVGHPNQNKIGDYYHMISDSAAGNLAWAATFNGEQDVYFLRVGDCNINGLHDSLDIMADPDIDCNQNGFIDQCEENVICTTCSSDADCDDGLYCNGAEACVAGVCQAGSDPCPGESCDETSDQCVVGPVYADDFESASGWSTNPDGIDSATAGMWERNNPEGTDLNGPKQLNDTISGVNCLVTGALAGSKAGAYDVDGGKTSIRSPQITLPAGGNLTLSFYYYLAHSRTSSSEDYLRVKIVGATTTTVFEELGAAVVDNAQWDSFTTDLNSFAGQVIYLLIEAADGGGGSLVEAAIDDVEILVVGSPAPTCSDGILNQGEDRIDCGGPCAPCECLADPDCSDSQYCNGAENCDQFGTCQSGSDPCAGQGCDENTDTCVECLNDGDCDDGQFCNGVETCVDNLCQAGADPCPGESCNETSDQCVVGPVYADDFESASGWSTNPDGIDSATAGMWERNNPEGTDLNGPKQLNDTISGVNCLVTGALAGSKAGAYDVDGGKTSIRSPQVTLPAGGNLTLSFYYYLSHSSTSSSEDYLRVKIVGDTTTTVFEELGAAVVDNAQWDSFTTDLNSFAGQVIYLLIEAADGGGGSLVEAAIDDVEIQVAGSPEPTCSDGILNQGEDRIDCGGPCPPCECLVDPDCSDSQYCNGAESCDEFGTCQSGSDPCSGQVCDEDTDTCVECLNDGDCEDGLFCNGAEACVDNLCQAGADPCPGESCDETSDQCVVGPTAQLEAGTVAVGPTAVTVLLSNTYISPVVVCSVQYSNNNTPVVARVFNVTSGSFDVYLQNPSGGSVSAENVSFLVMDEGVWNIDGVNVEAQKYLSTVTDENNSWVGSAQSYGQSYTSPVVIGQVMSTNDPDWSVFWCQGSNRSTPPSSIALRTGKTVCEDTVTTRASETVGFIVFETGHGTIGSVEFEALVGVDTVRGVTNSPPYPYMFNTPFASAPTVAMTTMAGVDGNNGGWSYSHGLTLATSTTLYLSIDEDQVGDSERNHTTEQVGYVVFETDLVYP